MEASVSGLPALLSLDGRALAIGAAFSPKRASSAELFGAADASLRQNVINPSSIHLLTVGESASRSASDWRPILDKAIEKQSFSLAFQKVHGFSEDHFEVFCRIDDRGALVSAAAFWPLLERFGLHHEMDKLIVQRTLNYLTRNPELHLSVNLTPASALLDVFVDWLTEKLSEIAPSIRSRLTIELRESLFQHFDDLNEKLLAPLASLEVPVGVDRFGFSSEVLSRLHHIDLVYVKLDRRFIRGIDAGKDDRFYLRTLESICRAGDTRMIVEGVERAEQVALLEELELTHMQGFYFDLPKNEYEFEMGMK
jgi:EAL domain-containing protein (putative c-di-GMP-specific phosphodiesterase class I)